MYWLTGILGILFIVAPYFFGYNNNVPAYWTSIILGGAVAIVSVVEALAQDKDTWEYWVAGILGVVAIASPFILGFSTHVIALWTSIVLGAILILASGSRIFTQT